MLHDHCADQGIQKKLIPTYLEVNMTLEMKEMW
jgi:hypothetical protein